MNYLIYGSSFNLIENEVDNVLKGRKANRYSLETTSIKDILEDVNYSSMFEEEKIIIIKDFDLLLSSKKDNEKDIQALIEYLKSPNKDVTMLLLSKDKVSSRGVGKDIVKCVKVIETPIITKSYELAKLIGEKIKSDGYGISQNTLNVFSERCASNYDIALNEFNKLKLIKKDNKLITDQDVSNFVSNYNMNDIFGFKDAIINKDLNRALSMLDDLESSKMEIIPLIVMLEKEYSTLYNIKLLSDKGLNNDAIGKEMNNMHPYRVKLLKDAGRKYTKGQLEKLIKYLCNLDLKVVSQDNLGYDELRKFLLEI